MTALSPISKAILSVPALGYHAVQRTWAGLFALGLLSARSAPVPVISVGNIAIGGSGKTPFVIYLARLLQARGLKPAVISRGYRGSYHGTYMVVSDGVGSPVPSASLIGDEPSLMAQRLPEVPVIVGRKRIDAVLEANRRFTIDVALLDDGFQHLGLKRDADIVLLSGREDRMFPSGCLREPFSALKRADIVVLTEAVACIPPTAMRYLHGKPVFRSRQVVVGLVTGAESEPAPADLYADQEVLLVTAIARPERFRRIAAQLGWKSVEHVVYRDHHCFTDEELKGILGRAGNLPVILTEKDWVKLPEWFRNKDHASALRIDVALDHEDKFMEALLKRCHTKVISRT